MKRLLLSFLALALSLWLPGTCGAQQIQNTLKKIQETKSIKLGYLAESLPFSFADEQKNPAGYSVELCQKVAAGIEQQLGLKDLEVKWVPITLVNRFEMVTNGTIDLECGISTITVSRQKIVDFSLMTWLDGGNFMVKAGQPRGGLADLAGKKIAVIVGTTTDRALSDALKKDAIKAEIVLVKEHLEGLNAVAQGKADAYAADQTVLIGLALVVRDQLQLTLSEQNFSYEPYGLTLRRNDADFKQAVNQVLARLYRTGQIIDIYDRWFGKLGKPTSLLKAMFAINGIPE
ncbi:MAG TPA: amino acid ABC transporter substrate-binding protein [Burkholderiales bacterium]|nr:amino acid ABC transporter substrate-binding protein [Burkholderiales bacterium]